MSIAEVEHDQTFMKRALALAAMASEQGEVPVGALVVKAGQILGEGYNQPIAHHDPTAHAEIQALRAACQHVNNYRIPDTTLYVTLEPCAMCAGAIVHARVARVVYATAEPKAGAVVSTQQFFTADYLNHRVAVTGGVLAEQASQQLSDFFKQRRLQHKMRRDKGQLR